MDLAEGVGESSSPPRSIGSSGGGGGGAYDIRNDVYNKLLESGNEEVVNNPELFREQLEAHFNSLPSSYGLDINMDRVEDVLLHQKILARAKDPDVRPVYHVRFLELNVWTRVDDTADQQISNLASTSKLHCEIDNEGIVPSHSRKNFNCMESGNPAEDFSKRPEMSFIPVHEVIFSTLDKPKLLSQLSALLSDIGLNIREAHVFSTNDGYSLSVFVVDGWHVEDTKELLEALEKAINRRKGSLSVPSCSQSSVEKAICPKAKSGDWEIDRRLLKIGEKIASGSCGDLYHGIYHGLDVAVKVLRSEHLNGNLENEFAQEVAILRQVLHKNVVRFIGACSKSPHLCIVTEYMPGGSLYDYLHRNHIVLKLSQLLRFTIDICKGMEYLHQNNIIHRDLKTANLLMDAQKVINHQPYDQKADVFSFAIVLWELVTAKVPYDSMTPLQAALGVRQGLRPELPNNAHPKLLEMMQRCWEAVPGNRPSFSEIRAELEELVHEVDIKEDDTEAPNGS
ncbi:PREDICTED: serine/threonine-protein kinase STY46-like isoform X2 [Ipomoea nil]|uniref:serine/threonine-protein kinase STY46-like isoform X2 n=1 Tax=Ipomoea nil TaxID=35883 RepID=UPI0009012A1E|nr:PREDICTED: serine/threonine-protein kinase STY46-like isoform X2 [Ipomoea nil]